MFSPYYAWSGWREPENHCAFNVALYRAGADRWAMTERGRGDICRAQSSLAIGPSSVHWDGAALHFKIDERTSPLFTPVRGTVTLRPEAISEHSYALDAGALHHWRPVAPRARIEAHFDGGALTWSGDGYLDSNWGAEPLQNVFRGWSWSRAHTQRGTLIYYDVAPRAGGDRTLALHIDRAGAATSIEPPPKVSLPQTLWRMPRATRGEGAATPHIVRTLEDTPFYARSSLCAHLEGAPADIMHESLSLERFSMPLVRAMLPFRMPRLVGRR